MRWKNKYFRNVRFRSTLLLFARLLFGAILHVSIRNKCVNIITQDRFFVYYYKIHYYCYFVSVIIYKCFFSTWYNSWIRYVRAFERCDMMKFSLSDYIVCVFCTLRVALRQLMIMIDWVNTCKSLRIVYLWKVVIIMWLEFFNPCVPV